jgi:hypothetical protein
MDQVTPTARLIRAKLFMGNLDGRHEIAIVTTEPIKAVRRRFRMGGEGDWQDMGHAPPPALLEPGVAFLRPMTHWDRAVPWHRSTWQGRTDL